VATLRKLLVTMVTFERFFSRVRSHVGIEMARLRECLWAVFTLEWFLPRVHSDMGDKI